MKVAIFYDWLNQWGGAERVLLDILAIYPQADLYCLVHQPSKSKWLPVHTKIFPSFINRLPFSHSKLWAYTPIFDIALEQFDFSSYDIVISTTSTIGHALITPPQTMFVCYSHNINRHLYRKARPPLGYFLSLYRRINKILSQRPDYYLTNSSNVQTRIMQAYQRSAIVVNPGVDTNFFHPHPHPKSDYFLLVSRLVAHKKVDLAIDAIHQSKQKLIIIGSGRDFKKLKHKIESLNDPNIKLIGQVSQSRLLNYYQNCLALICPQEEDFGIAPIEAMACGKPVIAYRQGGITETVVDGKTGLFFDYQTVDDLSKAINKFDSSQFDPKLCRRQALNYSQAKFMLNFKKQVQKLWQQFSTQNTTTL